MISPLAVSVLLLIPTGALADTLQQVISTYNLNAASYNFSFPSTALSSDQAAAWVVDQWSVVGGKLDFGDSDVVFSPDPSTTTASVVRRQTTTTSRASTPSASRTTSRTSQTSIGSPASTNLAGQPPVLRIEYPSGSYSKKTGGAQFTSNFTAAAVANNGSGILGGGYERMLLSYDVWFPSGFSWTLGGKLPGLRGGPDRFGCSGGNQTDGTGCFSTRLMWRPNGAGEVYAYIPPTTSLCSSQKVICNSDYGVSLGRGDFGFQAGRWQTIWLMVVMNEVGKANGMIELWYNSVPAVQFPQSLLRISSSISSVTGLFFSTFFGGDDTSWASPSTQYIYYRNIQLFAGKGQSDGAGPTAPTGSVTGNGSSGAASPRLSQWSLGSLGSIVSMLWLSMAVGVAGLVGSR